MSKIVISVRNLKVGYGDHVVLQNISFDVECGEVFVILGGSGSGKSTLLKSLIGLYAPLEGEIWIEGMNLVTAGGEERREMLRKFGVAYQSGALFGSMNLLENVRLPLDELTSMPEPLKELAALSKLKLVGLGASIEKMPAELSGGMQKRAAIARAMALDPRILFGITFVVVSHDLASIYSIADRVIMLDSQTRTIAVQGRPAELRDTATDPQVRRFFRREPDAVASTLHL
jgi:phospholipid/cholesterol/gamma-HCH transport system ATP-binding protein